MAELDLASRRPGPAGTGRPGGAEGAGRTGVGGAGQAGPPAIEVEGLTVAYGDHVALRDVSLRLEPGELVSLIGPNGAGKSSLIKAILGIVPAARGTIRIAGGPIRARRAEVAYVPQREHVDWDFPVTVEDVVLMGRTVRLGWLRRPGRADRERVRRALGQVGLLERAPTPIGELSGGQQQRVFVARALVQDAPIMLLDEPLVGVDANSREVVVRLLRRLTAAGQTVVMATHDLPEAAAISNRLVFLNGRVVAAGPVEQVFTEPVLAETFGGQVIVTGRLDHQVHRVIVPRSAAAPNETLPR